MIGTCADISRENATRLMEALSSVKFTHGKHRGRTYAWVLANDTSYHTWLCNNNNRVLMDAAYRLFCMYGEISPNLR